MLIPSRNNRMLYFHGSGNQGIEGGKAPLTIISNDLLWGFVLLILAALRFGEIGFQKWHILASGYTKSASELKVITATMEFWIPCDQSLVVKKKIHHNGRDNWS